MHSLQLHQQLMQHLGALRLPLPKPEQANLALLCQALAVSPNCHLAALALGLPLPDRREPLIQRQPGALLKCTLLRYRDLRV
jgi:hypothetical protein